MAPTSALTHCIVCVLRCKYIAYAPYAPSRWRVLGEFQILNLRLTEGSADSVGTSVWDSSVVGSVCCHSRWCFNHTAIVLSFSCCTTQTPGETQDTLKAVI
ncbi:uncharacterized protein SPSK_10110 [Sporothrix schenckii 1099-18]|uniref:Uncharacterized protein n=1 Tax=Sporothrix schenckii 1099-18 TaxID=1397361 RepID=A0A0F2M4X3_SPOSC|nr:uncharacterized protein SPSK_10110 [Sporothrix schenckii 1099-18]KJR84753.1 hypothetical protein SPSK_10110 [Sporothrix schenckii 1099-18]